MERFNAPAQVVRQRAIDNSQWIKALRTEKRPLQGKTYTCGDLLVLRTYLVGLTELPQSGVPQRVPFAQRQEGQGQFFERRAHDAFVWRW